MTANFKQSLAQGQIGETLFYQAHQGELTQLDGRQYDFVNTRTGKFIELKTDNWEMSKTANFFFERFSDKDKQTPGGPWQTMSHGQSSLFVYFYIKNLTYFEFDTAALVETLEPIIMTMTPTMIQNKTYVTQGYRVPRELLKGLYTEKQLTVTIKDDTANG